MKKKNFIQSEQGMALLFAVVLSLLLAVLGLGLTYFSIAEFTVGNEFEAHQRAFAVADGGYSLMKDSLRGKDLSTVLSTYTAIPEYVDLTAAAADTAPYRNPIYPIDARNIDFNSPPAPIGSINVNGLLTPASGIPLGSGYFFARISDNSDGDNDFEIDQDYTIFLRVVGVHPGPLAEISSYGGSAKNSVSIVEALMKRDFTFDMGSPLSIAGPDVDIDFDGTSFNIDGDEEHPGVSVLFDDESGGDARRTGQSIHDVLTDNQARKIAGADGDYGPSPPNPSIRDDTSTVRESDNPDAYNVLNPAWLASFVQKIAAAAHVTYPSGTKVDTDLGTEQNPQITYCEGDLDIAGNGQGYGVLVVTGNLEYNGAFDFTGLVLVLGSGSVNLGGANKTIQGGMFVANLSQTDDSEWEFGVPYVRLGGNSDFLFDSTSIRMAINLLPLKTLMWREITPDIEPIVQESDQPSIGEPENGIIISTF